MFDHTSDSLTLSSFTPVIKALSFAVLDMISNFWIDTDATTPMMIITETSSMSVKPFWFKQK